MIPAWLRNMVLAALVLFLLVDLGAPLVIRVQLDAAANDAAAASGRTYLRDGGLTEAEAAARAEAAGAGADLETFEVLPDGRIHLALTRQAPSRVFDRVSQLDSWYAVRTEATSTGSTL